METFLIASSVNKKREKIDRKRVETVIKRFNREIKKGEEDGCPFYLNTGLDNVPLLNREEFKMAKKMAMKQGWDLSMSDDNYQTTSYKLTKLKTNN